MKKIKRANSKKALRTVAPADPTRWREKDQGSVAASYRTQYQDREFECRHCRQVCVFTADDQKITYEVKKAPIDQQRVLCEPCYRQSRALIAAIHACQQQWAEARQSLTTDGNFLAGWLALLVSSEAYGIRADSAARAMLQKLLVKAGDAVPMTRGR